MKVTVIGIFAVAAEKQQDLVEAINRAGEVVRKLPGFLGSTLYASVDGTRVVNQSHWTSIESHDAVLENPEAMALAEVMFAIAKPDPIICVERGEFSPA
ncbi:antibiotic biosynthesis monooxygenase family protein [Streptomyces xiangluensis]|uniref:Antibiotic biosynthesis monooxygenase family protein n=1 Tax=Streptomyces xiangluensis TaxID=2665720 RepID=A0ABV8ZAG3_9ACTN